MSETIKVKDVLNALQDLVPELEINIFAYEPFPTVVGKIHIDEEKGWV